MQLQSLKMIPPDLEFRNFVDLYNQLMNEGVRANGAHINP